MRLNTEILTMPEDGQQIVLDVHVSMNNMPEDVVPPIGVVTRPSLGVEGQKRHHGRGRQAVAVVIAGGAGTGTAVALQRATGTATSAHVTVQNLTVDVPLAYAIWFVPVLVVLAWQHWRSG